MKEPLSQEAVTASDDEMSTSSEHNSPPSRSRFVPPSGFEVLRDTAGLNPFATGNLEGKKVFLISVPSSAKLLDSVERLPLNPSDAGENLQTKQDQKRLVMKKNNGEDTNLILLVPGSDGQAYVQSETKISAHYTITERQPLDSTTNEAIQLALGPRPQPSGLKMRFLPSGWGNETKAEGREYGIDDNSDTEEASKEANTRDIEHIPTTNDEPPSKKHKSSHKHHKEEEEHGSPKKSKHKNRDSESSHKKKKKH